MGEARIRGSRERPEEGDYGSRPLTPDQKEDAPEADGRDPSDESRHYAPSQRKEAQAETQGPARRSYPTEHGGMTGSDSTGVSKVWPLRAVCLHKDGNGGRGQGTYGHSRGKCRTAPCL